MIINHCQIIIIIWKVSQIGQELRNQNVQIIHIKKK
jgi:hypothetical protein